MKTIIGRWVAYARRAQGYVSILNLLMLVILTVDAKTAWDIPLFMYIVSLPVILTGMILVGYIDTSSGIREAEMLNNEQNQPIKMEDHDMLKDIHEKLIK